MIERARSRALARADQLIEDALVAELVQAASRQTSDGEVPSDGEPVSDARETVTDVPTPPADLPRAPEDETAWWTYCVMWARDAVEAARGLEGVEPGSAVEAVFEGEFAALVSPVPLTDYGDERLREHLEDLEWVERTARRHEAVLEAALLERTVVPLRLCTLYQDQEGVRRLLRTHQAALREGLVRVEGCVEWGVKVFADTRFASDEVLVEPDGSESRGASYLRRRQRERALAEKAAEVRARCVEVVQQGIAAISRASAVNAPQRPEVHGRELAMLLNSAHLVQRDRRGDLEEVVIQLQEEWGPLGFTIELTGPWPPYNFVSGTAGVMS